MFDKDRATLLQYPTGNQGGSYTIPGSVTSIGDSAFSDCTGLTSLSIPESVTSISHSAFSGWVSSLAAFEVDAFNPNYSSLDGVLFNKDEKTLLQYPAGNQGGSYTIPDSVTSIGDWAFSNCYDLTSVTIPESVTTIGVSAFWYCSGLVAAIFLGDAPELLEWDGEWLPTPVFSGVARNFSIYYLSGSSGFNPHPWAFPVFEENDHYPAVELERSPDEKETWLLGKGLALTTSLNEDHNGDGISLLVAYALNLDLDQPKRGLPIPVVDGENLTMSFYGARPGIIYAAQTSTDLKTWTADGVTLTDPGPDGRRTASVALGGGRGFLQVVVAEE